MKEVVQREYPLRASGASTSDWIGQVNGSVIYSYDIATLGNTSISNVCRLDIAKTKEAESHAQGMPFGEHIREAIRIIKG